MSAESSAAPAGARERSAPDSLFGRLVDGLNGLGSLLIVAIMVLICADVLMRDLANAPIHGVSEMVGLSIIAIVFLQLGSTLRHGRMSRAELFIDVFRARRPRTGALLQLVFDLCGVAVCAVLFYATWPKLEQAWSNAEFIGVQGVFTAPTWPVRLIVLVGVAVTGLQYLLIAYRDARAVFGR
jgi:TRAP-type C4-dicarboxylate transport system permease small subunit